MFVELHLIQNIPPANLNRDDTGAPKDCEFGGHRRGRISSQSLKRAARQHPAMREMEGAATSQRTRRVQTQIVDRLVQAGHDREDAEKIVHHTLEATGFDMKKDGTSSILFFINDTVLDRMANLIDEHYEELDQKKVKDIPEEIQNQVAEAIAEEVLSPDIALFGRMIAVDPGTPLGKKNLRINAACQVAHAISTNRVSMDEDFFTAVDDLQPGEETGAGMMGVIDFNSSCYYRYSVVSTRDLEQNLNGDKELAKKTVAAWLRAAVESLPSGKQNSFAAHARPDFVLATVRTGQPLSLANAFEVPVKPTQKTGLVEESVNKMHAYLDEMEGMYGDGGKVQSTFIYRGKEDHPRFGDRADGFDVLVEQVVEKAFSREE